LMPEDSITFSLIWCQATRYLELRWGGVAV
jgi:hypothetical protein